MSPVHSPESPKARLAIRVGVTGHRLNRLDLMDEPRLRDRIHDVLILIRDFVQAMYEQDPQCDPVAAGYAPEPPLLRIVSPLAEGTDRLVAEVGRELGDVRIAFVPC